MSSVIPDNSKGAWLSTLVLVTLVTLGVFIGSAVIGILSAVTGISLNSDLISEGQITNRVWVRFFLMLNQTFTFLFPSYLFLRFFSNSQARAHFFDLGAARRPQVIFLSLCLLFAALPLVVYSYEINTKILEWLNWDQDGSSMPRVLQDILTMEIPPEFFLNILLVAIFPAIGEELVFRGFLMRLLQKGTQSVHLGIWLSAITFSAFHFQVEGFLPRMVLGLILGYAFQWTRSIWIPMLLHFLNNGFQVTAIYFGMEEYSEVKLNELPEMPVLLVVASAICIYLSARLILRYARQSI